MTSPIEISCKTSNFSGFSFHKCFPFTNQKHNMTKNVCGILHLSIKMKQMLHNKTNLESCSRDRSSCQRLKFQLFIVMSTIHNNFTSKSLDHCIVSKTETLERLTVKPSLFWPLKVCADHSRLFQLLSEFVNVSSVWMGPAVFVCVCLVGAERPQ